MANQKIAPLSKQQTRLIMAREVLASGARRALLLDDAAWGYARALRAAGFTGPIVAAQTAEATASAMRASCPPGCRVERTDILEFWKRRGGRRTALLAYGYLDLGELRAALRARRPALLQLTHPAGRVAGMTQSKYEGQLAAALGALELTHALGYPGYSSARGGSGVTMMFCLARPRRPGKNRGCQYRPRAVRRLPGGRALVQWAGYGSQWSLERKFSSTWL